jgi:5'-methylthioadenosine phosphorylase
MLTGLISGTGSERWDGLRPRPRPSKTPYGTVEMSAGTIAGTPVLHISRHGPGHERLSNHVQHRANIAALKDAGAEALVSLTVCGAVDRTLPLGSLVVFDDLYFPSNRLPDGSLCTFHDAPGVPGRGHWIFTRPFCEALRHELVSAARQAGLAVVDGGLYGHVDGPRFNSRAEIAALKTAGVAAVSQTGGPEVVLAGEAEMPIALVGFVTDYANGVTVEPQAVEDLLARVNESSGAFSALITQALPAIGGLDLGPAGTVYRFQP